MKNEQAKRVDIVSIRMVKEKSTLYSGRKINCPRDAYNLVKDFLENLDREALVVVCVVLYLSLIHVIHIPQIIYKIP